MSCPTSKCLCERLILSQAITFDETGNTLTINLPAGSYKNKEKYCIVIAQDIPTTTTISARVLITIGDDEDTTYSLVNSDCTDTYATELTTRKRYSTIVHTDIQSGVFKMIGAVNCAKCYGAAAALPS